MSNEATSSLSRVDLPETESAIPGSAQGELSVTANDNIRDKVRVATKSTAGVAIGVIFARVGELPDEDRLVARRREHQIRIFRGGGDARHPVAVAREGAAESQRFRHGAAFPS